MGRKRKKYEKEEEKKEEKEEEGAGCRPRIGSVAVPVWLVTSG